MWIAKDNSGALIELPIRQYFVCDRCGNTAPFYNGMETFSIKTESGKQEFCSQICVETQMRQIREEIVTERIIDETLLERAGE